MTASFGPGNFHESAKRLFKQAEHLGLFSELFHISEDNLMDYAPRVSKKYEKYLNLEHKGFGYYAWKSEIAYTILRKYPERGIAYIDAGCEINSNVIAKTRLKWILKQAELGTYLHVLDYPEINHTKKKVLDYFSLSQSDIWSPQIQATWFFLAGLPGKQISESWLSSVLEDISLLDDSRDSEYAEFLQHRYDQSLFSCAIKQLGIAPTRFRPCYRPETFKSGLRCLFHPVWSARNRTGVSLNYFQKARSFE